MTKNTATLESIELRQNAKLAKLLEEKVSHDPKQNIHNFSSHALTPIQEQVLIKGLNYATPPKKLKYENHMLPFELLYRDIKNLDKKEDELVFAKVEGWSMAFSACKMNNKRDHRFENVSKVVSQTDGA